MSGVKGTAVKPSQSLNLGTRKNKPTTQNMNSNMNILQFQM